LVKRNLRKLINNIQPNPIFYKPFDKPFITKDHTYLDFKNQSNKNKIEDINLFTQYINKFYSINENYANNDLKKKINHYYERYFFNHYNKN
jgi:hypothetical protein